MATYTTNYNFKKPGISDFYNIADFNDNADKIDSALAGKAAASHTHTKSQITDFPSSLPANGGNADTVDNKHASDFFRDTTVNLLKPTLATTTVNGVTCTNNGDGTYTLNGTASPTVWFDLKYIALDNKTYKICGCPPNGSASTYEILYGNARDFGGGGTVNGSSTSLHVYIVIRQGVTVSNLVFKPMITTNLNATYDDFVAYTGDTGKLNSDVAEIRDDLDTDILNFKMLGYTVPREMPVQNYVDSNGVFHQKVDRVDLGSLSWGKSTASPNEYFYTIQALTNCGANGSKTQASTNVYLKDYCCCKRNDIYNISGLDNCLAIDGTGNGNCGIYIINTSYVDTASFKSAMSGTYLYYELATERTISVDGNEVTSLAADIVTTNLLKPTLATTTVNGVTCTNNGDGTYTLNGTASGGDINVVLCSFDIAGTYKTVGCPQGGSENTYLLNVSGTSYGGSDFGNGKVYTYTSGTTHNVAIVVRQGVTVSNLVFKPMITTNLNATYDDFVPYTGDTGKLNSDVARLAKGWEFIGAVTGKNSVNIDSNKYNEFYVEQKYSTQSSTISDTHTLISNSIPNSGSVYFMEKYGSVEVYPTYIRNSSFYYSSADQIASTTMTVYGRR